MKKTTILMAIIFGLHASATAQRISKLAPFASKNLEKSKELLIPNEKTAPTNKVNRMAATAFYTQDFAGGIPAGWTQTPTPSAALWEGRTMVGADTLGSRGAYSSKVRIKSPTVANGFVIFDSDYLDNGGTIGGTGAAKTPHKGILTSKSIDCSAHSTVLLHFNQYMARFACYTSVLVSNGTKDSLYAVNVGTPTVNHQTAADATITLNITDIAAGQAAVTIAFVFDGSQAYPGASAKGYYFWQIDDIALSEADPGNLVMEDDGVVNYHTPGLSTQIPLRHLTKGFKFDAEIYNLSGGTIANVQATATITNTTGGGAVQVAKIASPAITVGAFKRDTIIWSDSTVALPGKGIYTVVISVGSPTPDPDLTNNSVRTYKILVQDSTFGRDEGKLSQTLGTANYTGGNAEGFGIGNEFTIVKLDTLNSISVYLGSTTTPGSSFEVQVVDTGNVVLANSDIYTVKANDPGTFVKLYFTSPLTSRALKPGNYYGITYTYLQNQTTSPAQQITFGDDQTIPQPPATSELILGGTHYPNGNAWLLRINMGSIETAIASIASKNGISLSQNVPNPFNGISTIKYTIAAADKVSLEVTDITGRKVAEFNEGVKAAGNYEIQLNANDYNKGIYFYTLRVGTTSLTKKMVIAQ